MIEPAKEYDAFLGEVWIVSGKWLEKPENQRAAVDLLKATLQAFRKARSEYSTRKSITVIASMIPLCR
jgi:hypothetical protein